MFKSEVMRCRIEKQNILFIAMLFIALAWSGCASTSGSLPKGIKGQKSHETGHLKSIKGKSLLAATEGKVDTLLYLDVKDKDSTYYFDYSENNADASAEDGHWVYFSLATTSENAYILESHGIYSRRHRSRHPGVRVYAKEISNSRREVTKRIKTVDPDGGSSPFENVSFICTEMEVLRGGFFTKGSTILVYNRVVPYIDSNGIEANFMLGKRTRKFDTEYYGKRKFTRIYNVSRGKSSDHH